MGEIFSSYEGFMSAFRVGFATLLAAGAFTACVTPPVPPPVAVATHAEVTDSTAESRAALAGSRVIDLARVQFDIPRGTEIGNVRKPPFFVCEGAEWGRAVYEDSRYSSRSVEWKDNFHRVMTGHGYQIAGAPGQLFEERNAVEPDFLVGANVTHLRIDGDLVCSPFQARVQGMKGTGVIAVEWQVFDPVSRRVVHQVKVEGRYETPATIPNHNPILMYMAFGDAANKLALDPKLREIVSQQRPSAASAARNSDPDAKTRWPLRRLPLLQQPINDNIDRLRSATVLVETGSGHGSGFLITEDGFMVTNKHVVGGQRFVRVRLVSGRTVVGEVVRLHELRDVALVKLEGSGYTPMAVRETPVKVTEDVYVIGAPRLPQLAWTVTRGVVSAWRPARLPSQPYDLIQSDVAIHGGNSGGPMLDRQGNLVGIAVAGYAFGPDKQGNDSVNLFIPILDGLDKLGLELVEPTEYQRRRSAAAGQ
jgi:S1-C subfamily serine protease